MKNIFSVNRCSMSMGGSSLFTNLSVDFPESSFTTVSGPSGCGKSTLLQLLLGFLRPSSGNITFMGEELTTQRLSFLRQQVSVVFQEPSLQGDTVEEALMAPFLYKQNKTIRPSKSVLVQTLNDLNLTEEYLNKSNSKLSGGEKQRIALARALLLNRPVMILDEVSSALDALNRDLVFRLLNERKQTTIIVSHDKEWIEKSEHLLTLSKGGNHVYR